ncbi:MAG: sugar ABC transporter permease [Chloroflexi bacterium]|nr:sugar ABC transporter permease [Chloroflexota bacterium]
MIGRRWWAPWLWLAPALMFLGIYLVYPVINTAFTSFLDKDSGGGIVDFVKDPSLFVGLDNYRFIIENPQPLVIDTHGALFNTLLWIVIFPTITVGLGLVLAVLTSRVRYEAIAKAAIFVPMAVSFVAAAVIWRFMYEFNPDIGTVNAATTSVGLDNTAWLQNTNAPQTWLTDVGPNRLPGALDTLRINNFALITVGVWMWTGFAMVVLSAGLRSISTEVLEAARVDGANEWQIFRRIIIPMLSTTIVVVATTLVINALKLFDLVFVLTGGRFDTDVIASLFFRVSFVFGNFGLGAALAVVLLVAVVPLTLIGIRRFQLQEQLR